MHVIKWVSHLSLLFALGLTAPGCSDDTSEVADPSDAGPRSDAAVRTIDLVGTWTASAHIFTNNANPDESFDLVANGGETRMVVLNSGGARTFRNFNGTSDDFDAQLSIIDNILRATSVETPPRVWNWEFVLSGDTLTLDEPNQPFDFTMTGGPEVEASEHIVFELQ